MSDNLKLGIKNAYILESQRDDFRWSATGT